jgi:hypothetical protein
MTTGLALQRYGEGIAEEQEVLLSIADIIITTACSESALLRAIAAPSKTAALHADAAVLIVNNATNDIEAAAKRVLAAIAQGDDLRMYLAALRRMLKSTPVDAIAHSRRLADQTIQTGGYNFQ